MPAVCSSSQNTCFAAEWTEQFRLIEQNVSTTVGEGHDPPLQCKTKLTG